MRIHLIFGNRKSGTTLLQRLVDNEHIFCPATETIFHNYRRLNAIVSGKRNLHFSDIDIYFPCDHHQEEIGFDEVAYQRAIMEKVRSVHSVSTYIDCHLNAVLNSSSLPPDPETCVIKNTGGTVEEIVGAFLDSYPHSKAVAITRDPKFTVRAIINDRRKKDRRLSLVQKLRYIFEAYSTQFDLQKYADDPRVLLVSFEELRKSPGDVLKRVTDFLNIEFTEKNQLATVYGRPTSVVTHSSDQNGLHFSSPRLRETMTAFDYLLVKAGYAAYVAVEAYVSTKRLLTKPCADRDISATGQANS